MEVSWIFFLSPRGGSGMNMFSCFSNTVAWVIPGKRNEGISMERTMQIFTLMNKASGIPIGDKGNKESI